MYVLGLFVVSYLWIMEKEMATHYSTLAWRSPWTEEPSRLQSTVSQQSDTTWWWNHHHCLLISRSSFLPFLCIDHWRRLSCLFLLFFGTLHSDADIFPFLLCFLLLFFSQLFVRLHDSLIVELQVIFNNLVKFR